MSAAGARRCDLLVLGSGAAGLTAAIAARKRGLEVVVAEKAPVFGGTSAQSGGYLWIPCNGLARAAGIEDRADDALRYIAREAGNHFDRERAEAFVENGARMVSFLERETAVRFFLSPAFPDYHPDAPGALKGGRSMGTVAYDGRALGADLANLRRPLPQITFFGMFLGSGLEIQHYFNVTRSLTSAAFVARSLARHLKDLAFHGRGTRLTQGGALVARLARTALDLGIPMLLSSPADALTVRDGRVAGARLATGGGPLHVDARAGVVLACGGFPGDAPRRAATYPLAQRGEPLSPTLPGNTGDGIRLAERAGGVFSAAVSNVAAWVPVSRIPGRSGAEAAFPHLTDRTKPGFILVNRAGRRFVNEADSYHDVVQAMLESCRTEDGTVEAVLLCDRRAIDRYGLGFAKPFPVPRGHHERSGYLLRAGSLEALATLAGVDPAGLAQTVAATNADAADGRDRAFGKGGTAYNRYQGDPKAPHPNLAPVARAPFYAVRVQPGEIATFAGLRTDGKARVLDAEGQPIPGLYAAGNDALSVMGGAYPGAGITLGPAMTFGFVAGQHAADSLLQDGPPPA